MDLQHATTENYSSSFQDSPSKWKGKDGKRYAYKKSSYQYSSTGNNNASYLDRSTDKNIDQLDELLEDLKNEREHTKDIDLVPTTLNYRTIERNEQPGTLSRTTRVVKTSQQTGSNQVPIEIENIATSDYSTLKSSGYYSKPSTLKRDEYQVKDVSYGSSRNIPDVYGSKNKIYESSRTFENVESIPVGQSSSTTLSKDLQNMALSDDILPLPGTKVTTTVRTFTYEIPSNSPTDVNTNHTLLYNNNSYNTIQRNETNHLINQRSPPPITTTNTTPKTVVYNTESYSTVKRNEEIPIVTNYTKEVRDNIETNVIRNDLPPLQQHRSPTGGHPGSTNKTYVYKVNTTENVHSSQEPPYYRGPSQNLNYSPQNLNYPPPPQSSNYPPHGPITNRYYYRESNVTNTTHGPGGPIGPGSPGSPNEPIGSPQKLSPIGYPPQDKYPAQNPQNNSTIVHKYSVTNNTSTRQSPDYGSSYPVQQPAPFPVDGISYPVANGNPPRRVDDLMQSFGNGDTVDRSDIEIPHRKREVETAVASPNQQKIPSINKAGKEVYYPPGHEMMLTQREEMSAGSAGGGRWAKGSGNYEYESGSKSKTKTKSGGAVVPVCLPLCCAMPCSIM